MNDLSTIIYDGKGPRWYPGLAEIAVEAAMLDERVEERGLQWHVVAMVSTAFTINESAPSLIKQTFTEGLAETVKISIALPDDVEIDRELYEAMNEVVRDARTRLAKWIRKRDFGEA